MALSSSWALGGGTGGTCLVTGALSCPEPIQPHTELRETALPELPITQIIGTAVNERNPLWSGGVLPAAPGIHSHQQWASQG